MPFPSSCGRRRRTRGASSLRAWLCAAFRGGGAPLAAPGAPAAALRLPEPASPARADLPRPPEAPLVEPAPRWTPPAGPSSGLQQALLSKEGAAVEVAAGQLAGCFATQEDRGLPHDLRVLDPGG